MTETDDVEGRVTSALTSASPAPDTIHVEALESADDDDSAPYIVHGIALGVDEVTVGQSNIPTWWPESVVNDPDVIEELVGTHLIRNHPDDPGIEDIVGEVTDAEFIDNLGLGYRAEVDDPDVARQVERDRVSVSPYLYRSLGGERDFGDETVRVVSEILGIRDLGVVRDGAFPSASISPGENPDMSTDYVSEALSQAFGIEATREDDRGSKDERTGESGETHNTDNPQQSGMGTDNPSGGDDDPHDGVDVEGLRSENQRLKEEHTEVRRLYAEALAEDSLLDAESIAEKFTVSELREKLENTDAGVEALSPAPRTGESEQDTADGSGHGDDTPDASPEEIEALERRISVMRNQQGMDDYVEQLETNLAELNGEN